MKVTFKLTAEMFASLFGKTVKEFLATDAVELSKNDFYSRPCNAQWQERWTVPNSPMRVLCAAIHGGNAADTTHYVEWRTRPGIYLTESAVSYSSCRANMWWIKALTNGNVEIGFSGVRHGLTKYSYLFGHEAFEKLAVLKPDSYETSIADMRWFETLPEYLSRVTGKSMEEWRDIPISARNGRLLNLRISKQLRDLIIAA